ncbi:MAG TPA: SGNH/GDSL hydrolase family protein [Allosphingosinicella sp.]|nr:SGNH/GDSL hydrolase family protein [Allosphingosinicella sp.]
MLRPVSILLAVLAVLASAACADASPSRDAPAQDRAADERPFTSLVVFGDSLVDAGNVHLASSGTRAAASQGYVAGRFTNGYSYADRIAMSIEGRVTTPSRAGGNNFAWGGARALANEDGLPDAAAQVAAWRAASPGRPDPRTLFLLTFGGNDLRRGGATDASHREVARSYADAVRALLAAGARTILVTGAPIPSDAGLALQRTLNAELDRIPVANGQRILRYDFLPLWQRLLTDARSLGFRPWTPEAAASAAMPGARRNAGDDCLADRAQAQGCPGYVLFDRVHPTAAVHALIARDMSARLGVPVADPPAR